MNLPAVQREKLATYCTELERWNLKMNLTGLKDAEMVRRLVVEPVWIGAQLEMSGSLTDIGSGNGSPAIPLAVTRPFQAVHLVESRLKRAAFLRHLTGKLGLTGVSVHHDRFEDVASQLGTATWITLQAVALSEGILQNLQELCAPTTKVVWITARGEAPMDSATTIRVPGSETEAWVFGLDQS